MKTLADSQGWSLEIKIFYSCINLSWNRSVDVLVSFLCVRSLYVDFENSGQHWLKWTQSGSHEKNMINSSLDVGTIGNAWTTRNLIWAIVIGDVG
jgi:hypothetical protein